jgi:multicopper oxidase
MIDRRRFLVLSAVGAAAGLAAGCSRTAEKPVTQQAGAGGAAVEVNLNPGEADVDLGGLPVRTWTYGGQVPAKEIRLRKGQALRAPVTNSLPQETSIHWHGLAIPNAMDGVPVLTQPAIAPGQSFKYEWTAPETGTY